MSEWKGPVVRDMAKKYLYALPVFILFFFFVTFVLMDTGVLVFLSFWVPVFLLYYSFRHTKKWGKVGGYVHSRWEMDKDHVCWRIDQAIRNRGVNVTIAYDGDNVIFPLSPLNIVVMEGWSKTRVFVGPLTKDNKDKIIILTAFVDGVMGETPRGY